MIIPDVNVLVAAFRVDATHHERTRPWLQEAVAGGESLGLTPHVIGGTARILTHRRIFAVPSSPAEVFTLFDDLLAADGVVRVCPGPRHYEVFADLCQSADARGALVADAQHAAVAIEHGATWVTLDRDFARFPGLRWRTPWE